MRLPLTEKLGDISTDDGEMILADATWYLAPAEGAGLVYHFDAGALAAFEYLTADLFLDGNQLAVFQLDLVEAGDERTFTLTFGALNQCSARLRMPLEAVNQNRWMYEREGALLKPICRGDRVDLDRVDRLTFTVLRRGTGPVRWCMTPLTATADEPPRLTAPALPAGALLDDLGQSTLHDWPAKSRSAQEVTDRLVEQRATATARHWPEDFSRWGGWSRQRTVGTGFFRTHHDGERWWLVDPDGYLFWSAGADCVRRSIDAASRGLESALTWLPEPDGPYAAAHENHRSSAINYLAANLVRAFGAESWQESWATIALAVLRQAGFNTVGNWSDWQIARAAGFPYVRPMHLSVRNVATVYRDFPDVFDPAFARTAEEFAEQLRSTIGDPAMIGYFLMNEPTWGFATESPAAGMLYTTSGGAARQGLAEFLRNRHGDDAALSRSWDMDVTFTQIAEGKWRIPLTAAARTELAEFSTVMVERLYGGLSAACRAVDPDHLNLGARYHTVPPSWALAGMDCFDVFSINNYRQRVPATQLAPVSEQLNKPVLIGEWHFGALDVGLPASGIGRVHDQVARGQAFRVYTEDAATQPWCVGVHYFTLYDQSALGRFDGENYNIGLVDVCHQPYEPVLDAARASHEVMYRVRSGAVDPYDQEPEYLPRLFL